MTTKTLRAEADKHLTHTRFNDTLKKFKSCVQKYFYKAIEDMHYCERNIETLSRKDLKKVFGSFDRVSQYAKAAKFEYAQAAELFGVKSGVNESIPEMVNYCFACDIKTFCMVHENSEIILCFSDMEGLDSLLSKAGAKKGEPFEQVLEKILYAASFANELIEKTENQ